MAQTTVATPQQVTSDAGPDWSAVQGDVTCPLCEYNLRGLVDPRCPECGYASTWAELLAERQNLHRYLFEHHPRRNIWSFVETLVAGLLPRRFWRTLTAVHEVRVRRLMVYHAITLAMALLPMVPVLGFHLRLYGRIPTWAERQVILVVTVAAFYATWPWVMLGALMLYRRSMWRASVQTRHLLRCVVYAWDAAALVGIAMAVVIVPNVWAGITRSSALSLRDMFAIAGLGMMYWLVALMVVGTYRLTVAYQLYLRMRRAWVAIPLAGVVVVLVYWNVFMWVAQAARF